MCTFTPPITENSPGACAVFTESNNAETVGGIITFY